MKTWFWIVLVAFVALAVYVVWNSVLHVHGRVRSSSPTFEVGADSALAYQRRVADLEKRASDLRQRMEAIGSIGRSDVQARLAAFDSQIAELKQAIDKWQITRGGDAPDAGYRQCILLYGSARGICDALAADTLVGK